MLLVFRNKNNFVLCYVFFSVLSGALKKVISYWVELVEVAIEAETVVAETVVAETVAAAVGVQKQQTLIWANQTLCFQWLLSSQKLHSQYF